MARILFSNATVRLYAGIALTVLALTGCDLAGAKRAWVAGQGGEISRDIRLERAEAVASRLNADGAIPHLTFHIIASDDTRAYSWPDGSIYLTRGLMNLLNDDELAAAVAHERGHLGKQKPNNSIVGLQGCDKDLEVEMHADAVGVRVLRASGISSSTMATMLLKVRDAASISTTCRRGIDHRIEALRSAGAR